MDILIQDIRYALRTLYARPGFTLFAVLTLALGIGASAAMFSIVHAVLLRPLPYPDAERLVIVQETHPQQATDRLTVSPANFLDWKEQNRVFDAMSAYRYWGFVLTGGDEAERIIGARVSADFFQTLGVTPALGRTFLRSSSSATACGNGVLGKIRN